MKLFLVISLLVAASLGCNKNNASSGEPVEIYLLKDFQLLANKCQIDPSSSSLQSIPIVANSEILEYSSSKYQFKIKTVALERIKALSDRTPFAVTVNKEIIYYGFFKPFISSSSCEHSITMDVAWGQVNRISMRLGYPGLSIGVTIDDERNNPRVLTALQKQGKLR